MGTFMLKPPTANALDVTQNPYQNVFHAKNAHVAKVNNIYMEPRPYSNCVVHDDTFDWGG